VPTRLTAVETVQSEGSWLFTARTDGTADEVVLLPCGDAVEAFVNTCTHEQQRLDRGPDAGGAVIRGGAVICPKHGSAFDTCAGGCENGPAAGTSLLPVDVSVTRGDVFLTDDDWEFVREGGIEDDDGAPSSTSHLQF
jgi:nitrite reductase/ring-hydroxylating ferredoxin subunit